MRIPFNKGLLLGALIFESIYLILLRRKLEIVEETCNEERIIDKMEKIEKGILNSPLFMQSNFALLIFLYLICCTSSYSFIYRIKFSISIKLIETQELGTKVLCLDH